MAILESQLQDTSFAIEISGYEFPDDPQTEDDANWLNIRFTGRTLEGSWSSQGPIMQTKEVEDLIRWLRGLYRIEPLIQFREPQLQFYAEDVDANMIHFQLHLSGSVLPSWKEGEPSVLEIFASSADLKNFARELDEELSRYPYRYL